jgi:uncharacterized protein
VHCLLKFLYKRQKYKTVTISISKKRYNAIIADTFIKKMIGLMYRNGIAKNQCMLFIFASEDYHAIWMQNMLFPIDVVWADSRGRIVDIAENLKPCKSMLGCKEFVPKRAAKYVLEFSEGTAKSSKLKIGLNLDLKAAAKQ